LRVDQLRYAAGAVGELLFCARPLRIGVAKQQKNADRQCRQKLEPRQNE
jgi:hypothetical protein